MRARSPLLFLFLGAAPQDAIASVSSVFRDITSACFERKDCDRCAELFDDSASVYIDGIFHVLHVPFDEGTIRSWVKSACLELRKAAHGKEDVVLVNSSGTSDMEGVFLVTEYRTNEKGAIGGEAAAYSMRLTDEGVVGHLERIPMANGAQRRWDPLDDGRAWRVSSWFLDFWSAWISGECDVVLNLLAPRFDGMRSTYSLPRIVFPMVTGAGNGQINAETGVGMMHAAVRDFLRVHSDGAELLSPIRGNISAMFDFGARSVEESPRRSVVAACRTAHRKKLFTDVAARLHGSPFFNNVTETAVTLHSFVRENESSTQVKESLKRSRSKTQTEINEMRDAGAEFAAGDREAVAMRVEAYVQLTRFQLNEFAVASNAWIRRTHSMIVSDWRDAAGHGTGDIDAIVIEIDRFLSERAEDFTRAVGELNSDAEDHLDDVSDGTRAFAAARSDAQDPWRRARVDVEQLFQEMGQAAEEFMREIRDRSWEFFDEVKEQLEECCEHARDKGYFGENDVPKSCGNSTNPISPPSDSGTDESPPIITLFKLDDAGTNKLSQMTSFIASHASRAERAAAGARLALLAESTDCSHTAIAASVAIVCLVAVFSGWMRKKASQKRRRLAEASGTLMEDDYHDVPDVAALLV